MGARGPAPKPIPFRKAEGNLGKRALPEEPKVERGIPDAPRGLSAHGRRKWNELAPRLFAMGVLSKDDASALESGCQAYSDWMDARRAVAKLGMVYEQLTEGGSTIFRPRPEVAMRADAWRRWMAFLAQYGLTASSRARVAPISPGTGNAETDFA